MPDSEDGQSWVNGPTPVLIGIALAILFIWMGALTYVDFRKQQIANTKVNDTIASFEEPLDTSSVPKDPHDR